MSALRGPVAARLRSRVEKHGTAQRETQSRPPDVTDRCDHARGAFRASAARTCSVHAAIRDVVTHRGMDGHSRATAAGSDAGRAVLEHFLCSSGGLACAIVVVLSRPLASGCVSRSRDESRASCASGRARSLQLAAMRSSRTASQVVHSTQSQRASAAFRFNAQSQRKASRAVVHTWRTRDRMGFRC